MHPKKTKTQQNKRQTKQNKTKIKQNEKNNFRREITNNNLARQTCSLLHFQLYESVPNDVDLGLPHPFTWQCS